MIPTMSTAFLLGVFGFVVAHRLTTSLRRTRELAGTVPVDQQTRTLSLCLACLVPAAAGLRAPVYMLVANAIWPPDGIPPSAPVTWFGDYPAIDVLATLLRHGPAGRPGRTAPRCRRRPLGAVPGLGSARRRGAGGRDRHPGERRAREAPSGSPRRGRS